MSGKILMFIASEKGYTALKRLITQKNTDKVGAVVTFEEIDVDLSWDSNIKEECKKNNIPFYLWKDAKDKLIEIIQRNNFICAITISWKFLLPMEMNNYLQYPLIVFHDSLLPKYRGFAPAPTAIMCGETNIGVTAIFANEQIDEGDIVVQKSVRVPETMYIGDIITVQANICADILDEIIKKLECGNLIGVPQNESEATYSIWRNKDDCRVDWNKSNKEIYNFIRAVGSPYPGAFTYLNNDKIYIIKAECVSRELNFAIRDAGKIWRIKDNEPEVICGEGILKIVSATYENGDMVHFNRVRCRLQ